ncbi:MAG: diguanylate cyclase (GGDEF domain) with PAS/PAC sensor [Candidatus Ozemobacter sibiricus]|uniref:Diguanylate cyclase (GGDEF domain) with PAS/PAC sensor n=1 Tax=Candidatus Ozemobacter sibiricus TaxID=2268124 RepID=A0A367ZIC7_9BACT|nr:MAG: diguanylate cyclase (GGDEF domain) with PAS/PAC sensor [Candidatus Ozemobacter sibiricus]
MEFFRNASITRRIVLTNLVMIALPVGIFWYIRAMELGVTFPVFVFLGFVFMGIGLVTSFMVAASITRPLERVRRRIEGFVQKKVANPVKDHGNDEIADLAEELNGLFGQFNSEINAVLKRQKMKAEEIAKTETAKSDLEQQLALSRSCLQVAQRLNTTFDFQTNLKTILDEAVRTMGVQWASILLINRDTLELTVACMRGVEQSLLDDLAEDQYPALKLKPHEGLAGQVIKNALPLIANKGHKDPRFKSFTEFMAREEKVASLLCAPIKGSDGTVLGVVNFVNRLNPPVFRNEDIPYAEDVCLLVALVIERNRLYRNLFCDETTGLTSHNVWRNYFEEEAARSVRYAQPLSVVVLDLDRFKEIIEQTAAEFVQKIGAEIGRAIQESLRETDLASKVQDRFYLLLPNTDAAGAVFLVGRLKERIEKIKLEYHERTWELTASAGIAAFPEPSPDARLLVHQALKALDQAKAEGRNRVVIHTRAPTGPRLK